MRHLVKEYADDINYNKVLGYSTQQILFLNNEGNGLGGLSETLKSGENNKSTKGAKVTDFTNFGAPEKRALPFGFQPTTFKPLSQTMKEALERHQLQLEKDIERQRELLQKQSELSPDAVFAQNSPFLEMSCFTDDIDGVQGKRAPNTNTFDNKEGDDLEMSQEEYNPENDSEGADNVDESDQSDTSTQSENNQMESEGGTEEEKVQEKNQNEEVKTMKENGIETVRSTPQQQSIQLVEQQLQEKSLQQNVEPKHVVSEPTKPIVFPVIKGIKFEPPQRPKGSEPQTQIKAELPQRKGNTNCNAKIDKKQNQSNETKKEDTNKDNSKNIVGTCQQLEKHYLRLVKVITPDSVRPLDVLQKAFVFVGNKYKSGERDINYFLDQLKSIRQDLTVQGIVNQFTREVYIANLITELDNNDLTELITCVKKLIEVDGVLSIHDDTHIIFLAISLLYSHTGLQKNTMSIKAYNDLLGHIKTEVQNPLLLSVCELLKYYFCGEMRSVLLKAYSGTFPTLVMKFIEKNIVPSARMMLFESVLMTFKGKLSYQYVMTAMCFKANDINTFKEFLNDAKKQLRFTYDNQNENIFFN
ncbi:leukocyte receptor cluster member, putative [Entamoeba invadens IP1]|uniref:leukocyte receptor cluster member, putative n=1 Tax=Entamoeba invadens IP1 TaxID=370355 RepID=UPI0002C3D42A|nr:leukocyte receptor cluster member, putative [Entamoeba invadens IP1]ELP93472.1 leukocyte receptor cluster member, putative [Entamoeba invadens IP1]|eukprot:XP_004260243.1 leukocyte receptor cluster member, putative [Entamoeba invadens IP1]